LLEIGNIYRVTQKYDQAIESFDMLIKNYPGSNLIPEAIYWTGKAFLEKGDVAKSKIYFNNIVNKYNQSGFYSRSFYELGKIEMTTRPDSAISYFKRVVELRNDEFGAESQYLIGEILFNQKKYNEAIAEYLKLRYAFAGYTEWLAKGLFRVAETYEILKDKKKAREFYTEVSKLDPQGELGKEAKNKLRKLR
jgi:TolA-binding protein